MNEEKKKFFGLISKENSKKIAKWGLIGVALLGLISLL